jgi:hypothetical protein
MTTRNSRRFLHAALLLTAALTLTAGSCRAAFTLRQAQDEYNAGVKLLTEPAPKISVDAMKFDLDRDARSRFQAALDIIEEGELTSGERPGHLRLSALTLQGYAQYALYRLRKDEPPKTKDAHYLSALAAIHLGPEYYKNVDEVKKPLVRREDAMLKFLHPLLLMEHVFQTTDADRQKEPGRPFSMAAADKAYKEFVDVLDICLALRNSEKGIPKDSPVVAEFVILALQAVQGACEAYSESLVWDARAPVPARKKVIEVDILGRGLTLVRWYISGIEEERPTDSESLPALAPKFTAEHQKVKTEWLKLRDEVNLLFEPPFRDKVVWEAP